MNIKDLFNEDVIELLGEETLEAIQEAFEQKIASSVETALEEQDELYSEQLQGLVKLIDQDHTVKLKKIVEMQDKSYASKLMNVVKMYERSLKTESKQLKKQMINDISAFIDEEVINKIVSKEDMQAAVRNKTAYAVLENLRQVLSVDSMLMREGIQAAVLDGKKQLDDKDKTIKELSTNFKALYEEHAVLKKELLLQEKVSKFSEAKQKFIKNSFKDKSVEFINENFDYTVKLFDKAEREKLKSLKTEALDNRKVKPDFIITEKVSDDKVNNEEAYDPYVSELSKMSSRKR